MTSRRMTVASPGPPITLLLKQKQLTVISWLLALKTEHCKLIMLAKSEPWGLSSSGRAPALHAGGDRFDPGRLHQISMLYQHERCQ